MEVKTRLVFSLKWALVFMLCLPNLLAGNPAQAEETGSSLVVTDPANWTLRGDLDQASLTDDISLVSTEPDGWSTNLPGWTKKEGNDWTTQSGGKLITSFGTNTVMMASPVMDQFVYEADLTMKSATGHTSLVFRSDESGWNSYKLQLVPSKNEIRLIDGGIRDIYTPTQKLEPEQTYHVKIEAGETDIKVYFADMTTPIIHLTNGSYTSGQLGIIVWDSEVLVQNVNAEDIGPESSAVITNLTGWRTLENGTLEKTAQGMKLTSAGNFFALSGNAAGNFIYEADITPLKTGGTASLVFRSNENGWGSYLLQFEQSDAGTGKVRLQDANDQVPDPLLIEQAVALNDPGQPYHLKVIAEETRIQVFWNSEQSPLIDIQDSSYSSGYLGLHVNNNSAVFQNILFTDLNADYSGVKTNLDGWQVREHGGISQDSSGLLLASPQTGIALSGTKSRDFVFDADITLLTANAAGSLVIRSDDSGREAYLVQLDHKAQMIRLMDVSQGETGSGLMLEKSALLAIGKIYHLRVKAVGSALKVYFDGKYNPVIQTEDSRLQEGLLGLHVYGGSVRFENIYVSNIATNLKDWAASGGEWNPDLAGMRGSASPGEWALRLADTGFAAKDHPADYLLEGDVTADPQNPGASGLLFRANQAGTQGYMLTLSPDGKAELYKRNGDDLALLGSGSHPVAAGKRHHIEIKVKGSAIEAHIDGYADPAITAEDNEFSGNYAGLSVRGGTAFFQNVYVTPLDEYSSELYRPEYHYSPARGWASDPNGLVYFEGEYHLFHQDGGQWAHAISKDLLHWKRMPIALAWNDMGHIWSGAAVADLTNASGLFGDSGGKGLIAYYTSFNPDKQGGNQKIGLAYSKDRGRTWEYYGDEAIIGNPGGADGGWDFRDPKVVRDEEHNRWVMVVSGGDNIHFLTSTDLIHWTRTDQFGFDEIAVDGQLQEGIWECPDFFQLAVDGTGVKKWVLMISTGAHVKTGGSDARYFIGEFTADGKFLNDNPVRTILKTDFGKEKYAATSFYNEPGGRRIMLSWMTNWNYTFSFPTSPWKGQFTFPRELSLKETDEGIRLVQKPVAELEALRGEPHKWSGVSVTPETANLLSGIYGNAYQIDAEIELPQAGAASEFGFRLREGGDQQTVVGYKRDQGKMFVDRSASGRNDFAPGFTTRHEAAIEPKNGLIRLRILVDASSVEVFGGDGETVISDLIFPDAARSGMSFYVKDGSAVVKSLKVCPLKNVWTDTPLTGERAQKIVLDRSKFEMGAGDTRRIFASALPYTADEQLVWETNHPEIVKVTPIDAQSAVLEAVAPGNAVVTARTADGSVRGSAVVTVGTFITNLDGWKESPDAEWVPTELGIRGAYSTDANYMSAVQAADFTYEADVTLTSKGAGSMLFRSNADGSGAYYFNMDPNMRSLRLFYKAPGKSDVEPRQVLATVPMTIETGRTYHVKIVAEGRRIQIYFAGNKVIDLQNGTYNQGQFGLNVFDGTIYYQNVNVTGMTAVDSRVYRLANELGGLVLGAESQDNFSRVLVQQDTSAEEQRWVYFEVEEGVYTIRNAISGKSLDWDTGQNRIQLYPYLGYDNQRWKMIPHEDGTVSIVSKRDESMALEAAGDGTVFLQARDDSRASQRWKLQEIAAAAVPGEID
ncbi:GH32 C-terminal domain-containing protein [Paenibacillus caui]|uniref:GH32 C-terminal domain-containing protein n=1 Tax=Paenibacillus caui TaxID=2873927 RepID=UPI001CA94E45|nr:GH32 C-terminal domain-containing protein [Paenibacillus caui]